MFFILILCSELASSNFPRLWLYVTRATQARLCPATCLYLFLYTVSTVEIPKAAIGFALHKCAPPSPSLRLSSSVFSFSQPLPNRFYAFQKYFKIHRVVAGCGGKLPPASVVDKSSNFIYVFGYCTGFLHLIEINQKIYSWVG